MAFGPRLEPVAACGPHSPLAVSAAGWVVQDHPEITPPSNFHHLRDTTASNTMCWDTAGGGVGLLMCPSYHPGVTT